MHLLVVEKSARKDKESSVSSTRGATSSISTVITIGKGIFRHTWVERQSDYEYAIPVASVIVLDQNDNHYKLCKEGAFIPV